MNVPLLRKIIKSLQKQPRRLWMSGWIAPDPVAPCGMAACIGGHAIILSQNDLAKKSWARTAKTIVGGRFNLEERARKLLRLNDEQAARLFYVNAWPLNFYEDYRALAPLHRRMPLGREHEQQEFVRESQAAAAVRRIEHFIKTGGRE